MWETIHIIEQMGEWKPKYVIWENVKNVLSRYMRVNFNRYLSEMERLGYSNNFEVLDAREFGLPQARERVFTVSVLGNEKFSFDGAYQRQHAYAAYGNGYTEGIPDAGEVRAAHGRIQRGSKRVLPSIQTITEKAQLAYAQQI